MADLQRYDVSAPVFTVTVAAGLADLHPQTLRTYDRLGLVVPKRARGRGRRYSLRDVAKLRHVQHLSQDEGINLEGIRRILLLEADLDASREQIARLTETLQRIHADQQAARVFTADAGGGVRLGRQRQRPQLALPGA